MRLANKTAVITGAGRGLGEAFAMKLAQEGASVLASDIDLPAAERVAEAIAGLGRKGLAFQADVRDKQSVQAMAAYAIRELGKVDILVNNAGTFRDNLLENISEEDWDLVLDTNLKGAFLCSQAFAPHMKARRYGKIVNISSRAFMGNVGQANYSASKGGVVSLTRTLGLELARYGINVNCVAPGLIDTDLTRRMKQEIKELMVLSTPIQRIGQPEEVANAVLFFASDEASFVVGQTLLVCGGRSVGMLLAKPKKA
jgi:NAD(P)-dependent dehydrogenase (short-subunit alcohol dehydrogenase family)